SRVVDEQGRPLVVYHGVKDADMRIENGAVVFAPKFDVFDTKGRTEPGAWFSPDPKVAAKYGAPIPFYLKAVAPAREEGPLPAAPENADAVYRMRGKGDSIAQAWEIAVFRPDQIKLAIGNRGTFDPANPDIRYSIKPSDPLSVTSAPEALSINDQTFGQPANYTFNESDYRPSVVSWAKDRWGEQVAPNGKPIWQNFVRWFGDSKVVDEQGRPLVVYHGTTGDIRAFDPEKLGQTTGADSAQAGFFFARDPVTASNYATAFEGRTVAELKRRMDAAEKKARRSGRQSDWAAYD